MGAAVGKTPVCVTVKNLLLYDHVSAMRSRDRNVVVFACGLALLTASLYADVGRWSVEPPSLAVVSALGGVLTLAGAGALRSSVERWRSQPAMVGIALVAVATATLQPWLTGGLRVVRELPSVPFLGSLVGAAFVVGIAVAKTDRTLGATGAAFPLPFYALAVLAGETAFEYPAVTAARVAFGDAPFGTAGTGGLLLAAACVFGAWFGYDERDAPSP